MARSLEPWPVLPYLEYTSHTFCLRIAEGLLRKLDKILRRGPYFHLVTHFLLHLLWCLDHFWRGLSLGIDFLLQ